MTDGQTQWSLDSWWELIGNRLARRKLHRWAVCRAPSKIWTRWPYFNKSEMDVCVQLTWPNKAPNWPHGMYTPSSPLLQRWSKRKRIGEDRHPQKARHGYYRAYTVRVGTSDGILSEEVQIFTLLHRQQNSGCCEQLELYPVPQVTSVWTH